MDVHANWKGKGNQILVTLIEPMRGTKSRVKELVPFRQKNATGFYWEVGDGTNITFVAAPLPTELKIGQFGVKGRAVFLIRRMNEINRGIVLSSSELTVDGKKQNVEAENFEFRFENGAIKIVPIRAPETFKWTKTPKGLIPSYRD